VVIETDSCNGIGRHNFLAQKLEVNIVWYLCVVIRIRTVSLRPDTILLQICTVWCTKLRKHFNAIMEVFYCFTIAIGLPGDASDYNEDKGLQLQHQFRIKVVWGL